MSNKFQWSIWGALSLAVMGYLIYSLTSQRTIAARTFLPGVTTHGHYQIELKCQECHSPGMGVPQDACTRCHGQDLKDATDTHPRSKFSDPGKAHLVKELDGRACITCHQEHVPDRTSAMGLSLPEDYCWHCHQDVGNERPSHKELAFNSCANAGCHNYHDNRALFENFLTSHAGEPDILEDPRVATRTSGQQWRETHEELRPLEPDAIDAPPTHETDASLLDDWAATRHAAAGINCSGCHLGDTGEWSDNVGHQSCARCHNSEVEGMLAGRHGMRLSVGLPPMSPEQARLPMKHASLHQELTCTACHHDHRFDTRYAAVEACLGCHDDGHSRAYRDSPHFALWQREVAGEAAAGTGVSCATCHMPRETNTAGEVFVQHNQNSNLRPNDKMIRTACGSCHGLQFTLNALADRMLIERNFSGEPATHVKSIEMAETWAEHRAELQRKRERRRQEQREAEQN